MSSVIYLNGLTVSFRSYFRAAGSFSPFVYPKAAARASSAPGPAGKVGRRLSCPLRQFKGIYLGWISAAVISTLLYRQTEESIHYGGSKVVHN